MNFEFHGLDNALQHCGLGSYVLWRYFDVIYTAVKCFMASKLISRAYKHKAQRKFNPLKFKFLH